MASPRTISILKHLSPQKVAGAASFDQLLRPNSPKLAPNTLTVERCFKSPKRLHQFIIDTPQRKRITQEGVSDLYQMVLGNGAFGTVYKAYYRGEEVAAKVIKPNGSQGNKISKAEKEAARLVHSNIVKVLKVDEGPALTLIVMELCGKSLQTILKENSLSCEERVKVWLSVTKALQFCHKMGIVHADVKPKNVLMSNDNEAKLADFGSAVLSREPYVSSLFHGTPGYAAPEVVCNKKPTTFSDIYSLGVLAWQMLSRKSPFEGLHVHTILYLTGKGITPAECYLDDGFEGEYKDLYKRCWDKICQDRISLANLLKQLKKLKSKSLKDLYNK